MTRARYTSAEETRHLRFDDATIKALEQWEKSARESINMQASIRQADADNSNYQHFGADLRCLCSIES